MTRSRIVGADGTRYIPEAASKRRARRIIAIISLIIASPFMAAAVIGLYLGATEGIATPAPTPTVTVAKKAPLPKPLPAALRACKDAPAQFKGYCIRLYLTPQREADGPTGAQLVDECLHQGYTRPEMGACLTLNH
jgi:hypothetical protein